MVGLRRRRRVFALANRKKNQRESRQKHHPFRDEDQRHVLFGQRHQDRGEKESARGVEDHEDRHEPPDDLAGNHVGAEVVENTHPHIGECLETHHEKSDYDDGEDFRRNGARQFLRQFRTELDETAQRDQRDAQPGHSDQHEGHASAETGAQPVTAKTDPGVGDHVDAAWHGSQKNSDCHVAQVHLFQKDRQQCRRQLTHRAQRKDAGVEDEENQQKAEFGVTERTDPVGLRLADKFAAGDTIFRDHHSFQGGSAPSGRRGPFQYNISDRAGRQRGCLAAAPQILSGYSSRTRGYFSGFFT